MKNEVTWLAAIHNLRNRLYIIEQVALGTSGFDEEMLCERLNEIAIQTEKIIVELAKH